QPAFARALANAAPRPCPAPLTTATLPSSSFGISIFISSGPLLQHLFGTLTIRAQKCLEFLCGAANRGAAKGLKLLADFRRTDRIGCGFGKLVDNRGRGSRRCINAHMRVRIE